MISSIIAGKIKQDIIKITIVANRNSVTYIFICSNRPIQSLRPMRM